jgi:hypothetical protein
MQEAAAAAVPQHKQHAFEMQPSCKLTALLLLCSPQHCCFVVNSACSALFSVQLHTVSRCTGRNSLFQLAVTHAAPGLPTSRQLASSAALYHN